VRAIGVADRLCGTRKKKELAQPATYVTLTGWRGADRDGRVESLPKTLPAKPQLAWKVDLLRPGLGGIAATRKYVVFGDRDALDFHDVWRCLDPATGEQRWEIQVLAIAELDYGNSPRTTGLLVRKFVENEPAQQEDLAFLLGGVGDLVCVKLATGEILWQKNIRQAFRSSRQLAWGYCGSPLLVDNKLIVNPGAAAASLVALDPATGKVLWQRAGANAGYGSLSVATLGGKRQIVGHDATTLGGWDIETGARLWTLTPEVEGDFNVPTPLAIGNRLLVTTENNGTRLYEFDADGVIKPMAVAENRKLKPSMSTPVVVGEQLFCVDRFLYGLDLDRGLQESWRLRDPALGDYAAILADGQRLLVMGKGELLLVDPQRRQVVSRWKAFDETTELYSHAALVGDRLYVRGETSLKCLLLREN
jgi:outer membrane protein assembly factor BamB